ncbi:MAG: TrbI/VirB10 family protein [Pseudobdellovibrionaceae bacterium]
MENKKQLVELTTEPKIESRFGFGKDNKVLSSRTIKVCSIATGVSLVVVFLMKSPDKNLREGPGVKTPEASQVSSNSDLDTFEMYSASQENKRIKEQNNKGRQYLVIRLPGLQKIDRHKAGLIPPGSLVKAVLTTGASNGPVKATTTEALRIQGETLIPAGATLLGSGQSTEERLMVRFTQVIFKDGNFENIQAQAADVEDKIVGLRGSRVGKYAMKYATAIGLNFVGGMAEGLQDREVVGQQVVTKPTAQNALLNGASKATLEMANETMTDLKNSAPIIQISAGQEIFVIFELGQ